MLNSKQLIFKELFVGTLIYAVVLGFFNDYTSIVFAKSFSTIFLASIVLEILTFLAFILKSKVFKGLKKRDANKLIIGFSIWLILFLSKFVFVWMVDIIFGDNINIEGFFGILLIVLCVTIIQKTADFIFKKLAV